MTTNSNDALELTAFVDGQLDLQQHLAIEERLRHDAALRAQLETVRAVRDAVRTRATYHDAPDALKQRIAASLAPARASEPKAAKSRRWTQWAAACAFAVCATVATNLWLARVDAGERIEQDIVASHVRATLGQRMVDVASSDHHTVKPWLSSKLDFSPPVYEPHSAGSELLGGRVDYADGHPVAALAYRHAGHLADEFIWPTASRDAALSMSEKRGFNIAHWTRGGMSYWLVSDMNAAELQQFARTLSTVQ